MPERIPLHSRRLVHYLLPSWSNALLSRLPSSSLPMLGMPGDGEGAGGQGIHHIWTHQSSRDTKLCSLTWAFAGIEMRRNESSRLYSQPLQCIVKQYIITLAFSGHFCSHMIKSSINILQWMFHFTPFNSIPSVAMHIFSARQVRSGEPFIKSIVSHTDMSTYAR